LPTDEKEASRKDAKAQREERKGTTESTEFTKDSQSLILGELRALSGSFDSVLNSLRLGVFA